MDQEEILSLVHDFGGKGGVLHLAHANGFPPATYAPLARALTDSFRVLALPARPLWPGSRPSPAPTWRPLANDLLQGLELLGLNDLVAVGHSLGGVTTLWAAICRPALFRAVVLIEPVILPQRWLWISGILQFLGLGDWQPLVRATRRRRRSWPDRQACFDQYRAKPFFARWSDEALWAYVEAGTRRRMDGSVELAYSPEWEAHIFATPPIDIWRDVPRLRVPVLVMRGEHSQTFRSEAMSRMARLLPLGHYITIPAAGHLLPMERPIETAAAIQDFAGGNGWPEASTAGPPGIRWQGRA
jgi:pimeloyl-ACP methyl ester carboxylesterase